MIKILHNPNLFGIMKRLVYIIIILISYTSLSYSKEINCASHNVYVIDADTIKLCNMKIRLNGISAAERGHVTYKSCKKTVEKIIAESDTVSCKLTGDMTYERHVGICAITKKDKTDDLQQKIIENGCARDCKRYSRGRYKIFETEASRELPLPNYCK